MAMDIVKRTIEILAKGTTQSIKEPFTNISRLAEDASKIRDQVAKGTSTVKDTYQSMRSGGGLLKRVTDWFYQRGDQMGSDFEDDDFDAGFDTGADEGSSTGRILDADSMKDIAKSQVGAMYRIGGKQVEASMMNTAEIITSVNARTTEITAAVNNLNKSLVGISKQLETISQIVAYKAEREEKEYAQTIIDSSGRLSIANIFAQSGKNLKGSFPVQSIGMMLQMAQMGGPEGLAGMLISGLLGDRKLSALGGKSFNEKASEFNDAIGTISDKILGKIIENKAFQKFFGDVRQNREIGGDYSRSSDEYNRNKAIFDGITRKTIIDVIPGYLREITKAISGTDFAIDKSGNLTKKHTDYFREDSLKGFGFSTGNAYKDDVKKSIADKVKAQFGDNKYNATDIRNAEAVLVNAAAAFFFMNHYQHVSPELVLANQDEIFSLAFDMISHAFNVGNWATNKPKEDWYNIFTVIMSSVMADASSLIGGSSNKFVTTVQAKIQSIHSKANSASQDYVSGKQARRLNRGDFVIEQAKHLQQYGSTNALSSKGEEDLKRDMEELERLKSYRSYPGLQKKIDDLEKKIRDKDTYARDTDGELHGKYAPKTESVISRMANPIEFRTHMEDLGINILRKMHDVIRVKVVGPRRKLHEFYPDWMKGGPEQGNEGGADEDKNGGTGVGDVKNAAGDPNNASASDLLKTLKNEFSGSFSNDPDSITGKISQMLRNRSEINGTEGRADRVFDAAVSGATSVGRAIKTRGASIRDAVGNFVDATIDDVKAIGGGWLDRKLEEQENRKNSIERAKAIRSDISQNVTISDMDKTQADAALAMAQTAMQDGDPSKEKRSIMNAVDKIQNPELKNSLKNSINAMLDVQSKKEVPPPKTKLGKILKWAITGLGVVFAPIIKVIKGVGSLVLKGFSMVKNLFTKLLKQGLMYAKNTVSSVWDLTKMSGSKVWGGVKSVGNKLFGRKQTVDENGNPVDEADYTGDFGDGWRRLIRPKEKKPKKESSEFSKEFKKALLHPSEKKKSPEENIEDTLKSEEPKGVFKAIIDAIGGVKEAVTEKKEDGSTADKTKQEGTPKILDGDKGKNDQIPGQMSFSDVPPESDSDQIPGQLSFGFDEGGGTAGSAGAASTTSTVSPVAGNAAAAAGGKGVLGILGKMAGSLTGILGVASIMKVGMNILTQVGSQILEIGIKPLKKTLSSFMKSLKPVIKTLGRALSTLVEPIADVLKMVGDAIVPALTMVSGLLETIAPIIVDKITPVIEMLGNAAKAVIGVAEILIGWVVQGVGKVVHMLAIRNETEKYGGQLIYQGTQMREQGKLDAREGLKGVLSSFGALLFGGGTSSADDGPSGKGVEIVRAHDDTPNTNHGSVMDGLTGSGDTFNYYYHNLYGSGNTTQYSYGNSMNMNNRGCGPVALADAYARRNGHGMNAMALASAMSGSGAYNQNRGTTVGGYIRTASSLGMNLTPGGVTQQSLRSASPTNPITVVGSGAGFGTRPGNIHYMNVVGSDGKGTAYVSNPLLGGVRRMPASAVAGNSVLGLYGSGDFDPTKYLSEDTLDAFASLKSLAGNLLSMFTSFGDESEAAQTTRKTNVAKAAVIKSNVTKAQYAEIEKAAEELWKSAHPKADGESDYAYNQRWERNKATAILDAAKTKLGDTTYDQMVGDFDWVEYDNNLESQMAKNYTYGQSADGSYSGFSSSAGTEDLVRAVATVFNATGVKSYSNGLNGKYTTPVRGTRGVRTDCSGYISAGIEELGYTLKGASSDGSGLRSWDFADPNFASRILGPDGQPSSDWISFKFGQYPLERGDITSRFGDGHGHVSMPLIRLTNPHPKGFDSGGNSGIKDSVAAARAYLAGESYENLLHSAMGEKWWKSGNVEGPGAQYVLRFLGRPEQRTPNNVGIGTLGSNPTDSMVFSYLRSVGFSPVGAAGVMGCFKYESGMAANNLENSYQRDWGYPSGTAGDIKYTDDVNTGRESEYNFVHSRGLDRVGYGLAQFTSHPLKKDLYDRTVGRGTSIDDASAQIDVLARHLQKMTYPTGKRTLWDRINNAGNASDANKEFLWHYEAGTSFTSDADVLRKYSKWMNQSDLDNRHNAAMEYFRLYGNNAINTAGLNSNAANEASKGIGYDGSVARLIMDSDATGSSSYRTYTAVNSNGEFLFNLYKSSEWNGNAWTEMTKHIDGRGVTIDGSSYYAFGFNDEGPSRAALRKLQLSNPIYLPKSNKSSSSNQTKIISTSGSSGTYNGGTTYTTTVSDYDYVTSDPYKFPSTYTTVTGSGDTPTLIPDINESTVTDALYGALGVPRPSTINNVTVVRDDGSSKREEMDAALKATYNVRSESIEAILEEILAELKSRKSSGPSTQPKPTSPEDLFDNKDIPVQIQRLTKG